VIENDIYKNCETDSYVSSNTVRAGGHIKPPCKIISVIFISMMMKCLWHKAETKQILTRHAIYVQHWGAFVQALLQ